MRLQVQQYTQYTQRCLFPSNTTIFFPKMLYFLLPFRDRREGIPTLNGKDHKDE